MSGRQTALVLAGGRSVRMGCDKATLRWGERSMLEAVLDPLCRVCAQVVVVAHHGQPLPALPPGVTRVDDPVELDDQGPLVGVRTGLASLADDDVVYLAATDKPTLTAPHVEWMFAQLADADAVVPVEPPDSNRRHRMHPLSGVLRVAAARPVVDRLVLEGERALRRVFECLHTTELPVADLPDPTVLRDVNTPEAYDAARREFDR